MKKSYLDGIKDGNVRDSNNTDNASDSDLDLQDRVLTAQQRVDCLDGRSWRKSTIIEVGTDGSVEIPLHVHIYMMGLYIYVY